MSLSYQIEHLAWKQRVNQEMSRAWAFPRPSTETPPPTAVNFQEGYSSALTKSHSQLIPEEHQHSKVNLAYTFGGFTPARFAFKEPKASSYSVYRGETQSRGLVTEQSQRPGSRSKNAGVNTRASLQARPKTANPSQKRYIQELQTLLTEEKRKREEVEQKLRQMRGK